MSGKEGDVDDESPPTPAVVQTPTRVRAAKAVSPKTRAKPLTASTAKATPKLKTDVTTHVAALARAAVGGASSPEATTKQPEGDDGAVIQQQVVSYSLLERELGRAQKRASARGKEADALRKRVQELEPEVRRLQKELDASRAERGSPRRGPRSTAGNGHRESENGGSPIRARGGDDDVALRGRVEAAEKLARILQLRCDQLEQGRGLTPDTSAPTATGSSSNRVEKDKEDGSSKNGVQNGDAGRDAREQEAEARRIRRQLEVAERRVKNSHYLREAHEGLAAEATAREREANARASEFKRRLNRALEKLESIERRETIARLGASCLRDEGNIHIIERELRVNQLDPELYLPINTAKRRQLTRSEQRLHQLRLRHASQRAALVQAQTVEQLHSDLRMTAGSGDLEATAKLLRSAGRISVNVPDETGLSAFLYACGQADAELIRVMLEAGGDVLDGDGTITGLIIAARKGEVHSVQALLDAGADVSARDSAGGTALHAAALRGHVDASRVLLDAGADCYAMDQGTNTPLHTLASSTASGSPAALATLLLEWGASVDVKNSEGLTPVSAALGARNRSLVLAYRAFFGEDTGLDLKACATSTSSADNIDDAGCTYSGDEGAVSFKMRTGIEKGDGTAAVPKEERARRLKGKATKVLASAAAPGDVDGGKTAGVSTERADAREDDFQAESGQKSRGRIKHGVAAAGAAAKNAEQ